MEYPTTIIRCLVSDTGQLEPVSPADQIKKELFGKTLKKGDTVEISYQIFNSDHSRAQLDKVHKCIRTLASETGDDFESTKKLIKARAGLKIGDDEYKSFADCSKEEISEAIKAAIVIGDFMGCNLNSI